MTGALNQRRRRQAEFGTSSDEDNVGQEAGGGCGMMEDVGGGEGERGGRQQAGNPLFLGGESAHVSGHVGGPFLVAAVAGEVMR